MASAAMPTVVLLLCIVAMATALKMSVSFNRELTLRPFVQKNALKVISGLQNLDRSVVGNVAWAASNGGASHVDIACDVELIKMAKSVCSIPVCVSSIVPADFVAAVRAGADMVEIGNFDGFYEQGLDFTAGDVVAMTMETRRLLPTVPLSVTIPHRLVLADQIELAQKLEALGADIIQTEGKTSVNPQSMGTQELIEKAAPTLASAYALSRAVSIPVMCASGLTDITAPLALAAGASGVGIGSMVNKLGSRQQMLLAVTAIAQAMGRSTQPATQQNNNRDSESSQEDSSAKQSAKFMSFQ